MFISPHEQQGRESWKYAWALDTTDEERAKGKTQECGRGTFETGPAIPCSSQFFFI
jgi:translation elongation factor EF-1alpha